MELSPDTVKRLLYVIEDLTEDAIFRCDTEQGDLLENLQDSLKSDLKKAGESYE